MKGLSLGLLCVLYMLWVGISKASQNVVLDRLVLNVIPLRADSLLDLVFLHIRILQAPIVSTLWIEVCSADSANCQLPH